MGERKEQEMNLIVVAAVEEYSQRHHMPVRDVLSLFVQNHITDLLRSEYDVLHMMDLDEGTEEI